ncbi:hypothetical protein MPH_03848 [Macrophomina phaseolina MS6]|uniref:Uncharacterized protein n=1 Tax=Macrophomina phaseolina (strain MS6) TaxID=1126212 RepID=K2S1H4_MACPH|nr:hypothetical protein MPH_03848 [Macrophomina phaseolina MS6]
MDRKVEVARIPSAFAQDGGPESGAEHENKVYETEGNTLAWHMASCDGHIALHDVPTHESTSKPNPVLTMLRHNGSDSQADFFEFINDSQQAVIVAAQSSPSATPTNAVTS